VLEVWNHPTGACGQESQRPTMDAIVDFDPVIESVPGFKVRCRQRKQEVVNGAPAARGHRQIRNPPDDEFRGKEGEIIADPEEHHPLDPKDETDGSEAHENGVDARFGDALAAGIAARPVEGKEVNESRDLVVNDEHQLTEDGVAHAEARRPDDSNGATSEADGKCERGGYSHSQKHPMAEHNSYNRYDLVCAFNGFHLAGDSSLTT
jgi:hypothetical protein